MQGFYGASGNQVKGFNVYTEDGHNFVLLEDYYYERLDGCQIPMPKGSTSDGASIPRALWVTLPPFGPYWRGAFLHDVLYRASSPDRAFCDETLLESMEYLGTPGFQAKIIYEGVSIGGEGSFDTDKDQWRKKYGF